MSVILPNGYPEDKDIKGPLFFLLGPEKGGGEWQYECYAKFASYYGEENFCAAIPVPYQNSPPDHPLVKLRLKSVGHYSRRLPWIRNFMEVAGTKYMGNGCIVGYLPNESTGKPRDDGKSYARKSLELVCELRGRMMNDDRIRFVLGADPEFPDLDVTARNFDKALDGCFKIHKSLDETVAAAIKKVTKEKCG